MLIRPGAETATQAPSKENCYAATLGSRKKAFDASIPEEFITGSLGFPADRCPETVS